MHHIIYLNLVVSASSALLAGGIAHAAGIGDWGIYSAFVFFATFTVYNGQRLIKYRQQQGTPWMKWVKKNHKAIWVLVALSFVAALIFVLQIERIRNLSWGLLFVSSLVSLFYVQKLKNRNLREFPFMKIYLIAFSWVTITVLFPQLNEYKTEGVAWTAVAHFFYVLAVTIPFDIRDIKYDSPSQKTIPQLLGVKGAKTMALFCLLLFWALMLYANSYLLTNYVFHTAILVQALLILGMNEKRSDLYCAGGIDGAISVLGVSYFLS